MREYELTIIIQPEISEEGSQAILAKLDEAMATSGATRLLCDDLGKRKLAYEIRKFHKGHYHMLSFLDEGASVPSLERILRLEESVLRFLTIVVDGEVVSAGVNKEGFSLWHGSVVGVENSEAFFGFSPHGSRGWYRTGGELVHLLPSPDPVEGWRKPHATLVPEVRLDAASGLRDRSCHGPLLDNVGNRAGEVVGDALSDYRWETPPHGDSPKTTAARLSRRPPPLR